MLLPLAQKSENKTHEHSFTQQTHFLMKKQNISQNVSVWSFASSSVLLLPVDFYCRSTRLFYVNVTKTHAKIQIHVEKICRTTSTWSQRVPTQLLSYQGCNNRSFLADHRSLKNLTLSGVIRS